MHAFLAPAELAYAFLARVLRTAAPSLAGVLSGTRPASLRSYSKGSYHPCFTVRTPLGLLACWQREAPDRHRMLAPRATSHICC